MPIVNILSGADSKIDINDPKITVTSSSQTYSGSTLYAYNSITVKYNGVKLTRNTDYTISGTHVSNKNAGTYSVTITGIGKYKGSRIQDWTINKKIIIFSYTVKVDGSTWGTSSSSDKKKISATGVENGITFTVTAASNPSGYKPTTYSYNVSSCISVTNTSISNGIGTGTVYFKQTDTASYRRLYIRVFDVTPALGSNYELSGADTTRFVYYSET